MFKNMNVFSLSSAMAAHAAKRQALVAKNIAHADTPGYRGYDLRPFESLVRSRESAATMRASRDTHLGWQHRDRLPLVPVEMATASDPNENAVAVEEEMVKAVLATKQHDRALAIYKSSMNILRGSLGRI